VTWPANAILTNSMVALKAMVVHGDGVAIMPRQLVGLERKAGLLQCIDLVEAGAARALGLSKARDRKLPPVALVLSRSFARARRRNGRGHSDKRCGERGSTSRLRTTLTGSESIHNQTIWKAPFSRFDTTRAL
jgi:hypothetical protein